MHGRVCTRNENLMANRPRRNAIVPADLTAIAQARIVPAHLTAVAPARHTAVAPARRTGVAPARRTAVAVARSTVCGGYEYEFVEAIADKYNCGICTKVLRDAQLTVCCGHHYCETCLEQWLTSKTHEGKKTCPHCREGNFQSFLNKEKIREINEFKIYCSHREKGCEWVGELGALKDHFESDKGCGYVEVKCTNKAYRCGVLQASQPVSCWYVVHLCGAAIERRHLSNHQENECVHRQYTCEHCGYTDTYDAIAGSGEMRNRSAVTVIRSQKNHLSKCPDYPFDCPNKCREKNIKRKNMKAHRGSCPLEPLDCPFQAVGCSAGKIARKDKDSHCQENTQQHLLLVVQSHQQLAQSHQQLAQSHQQLAQSHQQLAQSHQQLVQSHQQLAQSHQQLIGKNEELERKNEELARKVDELDTKIEKMLTKNEDQPSFGSPSPFPSSSIN